MAAKVTIKGGPDLRIRLENVASQSPDLILARWAQDAAGLIRSGAPVRTGALQRSIKPGTKGASHFGRTSLRAGVRAAVYGAYWGIFIDRGTRAHVIEPTHKPKPGKAAYLKFEDGGRTVFARRTMHRRMGKRPFITRGAQEALHRSPWVNLVEQVWSRKSEKRSFRTLT
jgi:hypothetical protein